MKSLEQLNQNHIKNILIVNVHSSQNAGDYALLIQTINYLKETFGNVKIHILANWPDELPLKEVSRKIIGSPWWVIKVWDRNKKPRYQVLSFMLGVLLLFIYKIDVFSLFNGIIPDAWLEIFTEYTNTDLVVAVSGNQLFSCGRFGWPLPVVGLPIYFGLFFHKKTLVFPQSVGPLKSKYEKWIVQYLYNRVDKLFIRDLESLKLIRDLNINKSKPSFMHDVAFSLPPTHPEKARRILDEIGFDPSQNNIGVTIISTMPSYLTPGIMQIYYKQVAMLLESLTKNRNFEVFLFCQVHGPTQDENDFLGIERVLKEFIDPVNEGIHILNKKLHPSELKACYGLMDLFIASRLHSGIFSLGMQIPTLFVGYLYKTKGMLEAINMEKYLIELNDVNYENISQKIMGLWAEKSIVQQNIHNEIVNIEKELTDFPRQIKEGLSRNGN